MEALTWWSTATVSRSSTVASACGCCPSRPSGRVAITSGALPVVLPVSFHLDGERILLRTRRGSRLDDGLRNAVVAFEADDVDVVAHVGWSVAVTGVAAEVRSPCQLDGARERGGPLDVVTG